MLLAVAAASPDTMMFPRIYEAETVVDENQIKSPAILAVLRGDRSAILGLIDFSVFKGHNSALLFYLVYLALIRFIISLASFRMKQCQIKETCEQKNRCVRRTYYVIKNYVGKYSVIML